MVFKHLKKKSFTKIGRGNFRCVFVLQKKSQLKIRIQKTLKLLQENSEYFSTRDGIFFTEKFYDSDNYAFIFPGQGSQYRTMFENLQKNKTFKAEFQKLAGIAESNNVPLSELIRGTRTDLDLNETHYAQPALALVEWSLFKVLEESGYNPTHLAGHSFGELVALAAGRSYSREFLMSLALKRGELMSLANKKSSGKMLAIVDSSSESWEELHEKVRFKIEQLGIELANINTNGQLVYSGAVKGIELFGEFLHEKKIKNTMLSASAAFHSSLMEPISSEFKEYLSRNKIQLQVPVRRVYSNISSRSYEKVEDIIENLSDQLTEQVNWVEVIGSMYQSGVRIFFEVGPRTILKKMIKSLLPAGECQIIAIDGEGDLESIKAFSVCLGIKLKFHEEKTEYLDLETKNKIVSGFIQKQKLLLEKVDDISEINLRESTRQTVLDHIREVVEKFFTVDNGEYERAESSNNDDQVSHPVSSWVRQEISRLTGFNEDEIMLDSDFDSDLSLDSITKMELFSALVGEFGNEIGDVSHLTSITSIRGLIQKLNLKEKSSPSKLETKWFTDEAQWIVDEISRYTGISSSDISIRTRFTEDLMLDSIMKMDLFSGFSKCLSKYWT